MTPGFPYSRPYKQVENPPAFLVCVACTSKAGHHDTGASTRQSLVPGQESSRVEGLGLRAPRKFSSTFNGFRWPSHCSRINLGVLRMCPVYSSCGPTLFRAAKERRVASWWSTIWLQLLGESISAKNAMRTNF